MSQLEPLREIQDLDLAADAARDRSHGLPEREQRPALEKAIAELDAKMAAGSTWRSGIQSEEERVAAEVAEVASAIEAAELERYSGKRMDREAASAHDDAQNALRERQSTLEERQMELLEEIESADGRLRELESDRKARRTDLDRVDSLIHEVEGEVAAELESLAAKRSTLMPQVPRLVLAAYDRVRAQSRSRGRGVARLEGGVCKGCHTELPSLQNSKMLAEPDDALIQCPRCQRVLMR
ncbi:MAG: zinc ribbon domain-containing protein [Myxococcota bacterium]